MKNLIALIERFKNGHLLLALIFVSILCVAKDLGGVITLAIATDRVISGSGVPQALSAMAIVMLSGILIVALDRYVKGRVILLTQNGIPCNMCGKYCPLLKNKGIR